MTDSIVLQIMTYTYELDRTNLTRIRWGSVIPRLKRCKEIFCVKEHIERIWSHPASQCIYVSLFQFLGGNPVICVGPFPNGFIVMPMIPCTYSIRCWLKDHKFITTNHYKRNKEEWGCSGEYRRCAETKTSACEPVSRTRKQKNWGSTTGCRRWYPYSYAFCQ